jgi:hypothetical protein
VSERSHLKGLSETLARGMWEDVRSGATHFQRRDVPPPGHPVRQFFHGLALPFHLAGALWAEPMARRRFLRVGIVQCMVILALALMFKGSAHEAVGAAKEGAKSVSSHQAERERSKKETQRAARQAVHDALARIGIDKQPSLDMQADEGDEASAADAPDEAEVKAPVEGAVVSKLEFWAALFAALQVAQWVVIALSRDFHDAISRDASLLTALEPEDGPMSPRIRLDLKWIRNKFSRRLRALMVFAAGVPLLYAISAPLPFGNELASVLISAWSAYWLVVFTTAKSAHAWENGEPRLPWFLRGWNWLTTRVPGFRWRLLQGYGRFWENRTRPVFSPAAETEKQPWAFAGLALARMLSMIPLVKCFLRPLIPVAAAHLLVARHAAERAPASNTSALPPQAPATHVA